MQTGFFPSVQFSNASLNESALIPSASIAIGTFASPKAEIVSSVAGYA